MEHRRIGQLQASVVGLGCNNFGRHLDVHATNRVVNAALDHGVNFFDTADVYYGVEGASEPMLGQALGARRPDAIIATKFGKPHPQGDEDWGGASPRWVKTAVEDSLRRLGTDWIDLYQLHEPDPTVPIEETLGALNDLVEEGKVLEIGHSAFAPEQIREAEETAEKLGTARFVSMQCEWNLLTRDAEKALVPAAREAGISILPFFPLSSGLLTGKYRPGVAPDHSWRLGKIPNRARFLNQERLKVAMELEAFAQDRGHTLLELAFSWLAASHCVASVIAGATNPDQIASNAAACNWQLSPDELSQVDAITARR